MSITFCLHINLAMGDKHHGTGIKSIEHLKGAFTHSRIAPRIIARGSSMLSSASPCIHRAGIRCGPWRTGISGENFPSWSTQMKNYLYHSWKAPCSFCVATEYIWEFRTRRMPVLIRGSRWLHGRNTVPSRSGGSFSNRVLRDEKLRKSRICRCAKDNAGCLPGVYTVML